MDYKLPEPVAPIAKGWTHVRTQAILDPNREPGAIRWAFFYEHDETGATDCVMSPWFELICDDRGTRLGRRL